MFRDIVYSLFAKTEGEEKTMRRSIIFIGLVFSYVDNYSDSYSSDILFDEEFVENVLYVVTDTFCTDFFLTDKFVAYRMAGRCNTFTYNYR